MFFCMSFFFNFLLIFQQIMEKITKVEIYYYFSFECVYFFYIEYGW